MSSNSLIVLLSRGGAYFSPPGEEWAGLSDLLLLNRRESSVK